jgi:hypothetical protein
MSSKRFFFVMVGVVVLLSAGLIGSTLLANGILSQKADELTELKLENKVIESQQTSIGQAKKDIEKYAELEQIAKSVVPQEKDQAKTVREIIKIAEASGVSIASISFPSSNLGTVVPAPAAPNEGESASPTTPAAPPLSQVKAVAGINGVYQLDISVQTGTTSAISYAQLIKFLERLEQNRRTSQVSEIAIKPLQTSRSGSRLTFNLGITVYIKP